jgi:hypothetical protein
MTIRFFLAVLAVTSAASVGSASAAETPAKPRAAEVAAKSAPSGAGQKEPADKALPKAAQEAGLRACRPLIDQTTRYLVGSSPSSGMLFTAPENASMRIATSAIEIDNQQTLTYASATFSPYGDAGCGITYDAVTYWKESCAEVSSKVLGKLRNLGTLGNRISMLDGGPTMRVFLMPAGTGCVQIKKEIIY